MENAAVDYREPPSAGDGPTAAEEEPGDILETRSAPVSSAQHGERLDRIVVAMAPEFSRSHLQTLIGRGLVRVDGAAMRLPAKRLKAGQTVVVDLVPTEETLAFRPEPMTLQVLYEDEHLLVLDKPVGLVVHPAPGHWTGTLLNGLLARHSGAALLPRAGIVHRLDKDTSGAMVVGKTLLAVTALVRAIAERRVQRRYLALCHGVLPEEEQHIEAPIGRDPGSRVRMAVVGDGKPARTDVRRLATADRISAAACTLHTGRTHQIRVHLAWRGHPLVADALYGGRPALGMARQALHAARLVLPHPVGGDAVAVHCPPPADFDAAWQQVTGSTAAGLTESLD
jgi:23S rRNA pseudouridine1911/1915/1917 synthase